MKFSKRFICMIFAIILMLISSIGIFANDLIVESFDLIQIENETGDDELLPMATTGCDNKLNHIFGKPEHNLSGFLDSYGGDQNAAYNAVCSVAQAYITSNAITGINEFIVGVNGFSITVRGNVIDGTLHIGTFFIA